MKKRLLAALSLVLGAALLTACTGTPAPGNEVDREANAYDKADATLTVGQAVEGAQGAISDELFGVFLEDINYASQALDADMVINGSFQSKFQNNSKYGWTENGATMSVISSGGSVTEAGSEANAWVNCQGKIVNNDRFARITVTKAGDSVANTGYVPVPMAVKEGVQYNFSAFLRSDGVEKLSVTVTDGVKEVVKGEEIQLAPLSDGWVKYVRTYTASETADSGLQLKFTFSNAGTVDMDGVSFATTEQTVGVKQYLYDAVKALSPKFFRFPGGCIIEGENFEQAYDWKNSIGAVAKEGGEDVVPAFTYPVNKGNGQPAEQVTTYGERITRKVNTNLWENNGTQYFQMEYGLGFYEYFLLCESMNATALPVVNCGLSCQGQAYPGAPLPGRHGNGIEDYIRDALDLVEFARGGTDTKWGKVRADMGHPEPFDMHYIGIGNEQWNTGSAASNYYTTYYEKFVEAFQEAAKEDPALYGDIQLIVGNRQQLLNCEGYEGAGATGGDAKNAAIEYRSRTNNIETLAEYGIQDHHYYNSPVDFFLNAHLYDHYTREGADRYEVFVGEYSANNTFRYSGNFNNYYEKTNNWFSALSEAAIMTGFERNGDIVKLAAYAPMFANYEGARHWAVDMMLYTNTQVVLTPNYYVQKLFMHNTGSRKLAAELSYASGGSTFTLSGVGSAKAEIERLYWVASLDEETGDIIVKVVNPGEDSVKLNIAVPEGHSLGSIESASHDANEASVLGAEIGAPSKVNVSFTAGTMGVNARGYSVTCIRIH